MFQLHSHVCKPPILQGHVIKGSCDFIGESPSRQAFILPNLVAMDTSVVEI